MRVLAIVFLLLLLTTSINCLAQQTSITPCVDHPEIKDDFTTGENYHEYSYSTTICDTKENSKCTVDFVYNIMKSSRQFIAPTEDHNPVNNCEQFYVSLTDVSNISRYCQVVGWVAKAYNWGAEITNYWDSINNEPIVTVLNEQKHNITNFTAPGHYFHPGKITRTILEDGSSIKVITVGVGTNESAFRALANQFSKNVDCVWGYVDKHLKDEVDAQLMADTESDSLNGLTEKDLLGTWYGSLQKIEYPKSTIQSLVYTIHKYSKDSILLTRINTTNKPADTLFTRVRYKLNRDSGKLIMYLVPSGTKDDLLTILDMDYFISTDEQPILNCQVSSNVWLNSYKLKENTNTSTKKFTLNNHYLFKYFEPIAKDTTKKLSDYGGSTPAELGKLLFKAIKTNNKKLWLNCIRPNNNLYSDLSNAFDDFRNSLMEQGVEDWNLLTYSRTTFVADPNSDGYVQELHGEKTAHDFQVEYYYNGKEFIGAFHLAVIATYNNGNYFMAAAGGSHLQATLDRNSFK